LDKSEKETIINFNQAERTAYVFTYDRAIQEHMEKKLGLKPTSKNSQGGRSYELPKKQIPLPRKPKKMSKASLEALGRARAKKSTLHKKPK